MSISKEGYEPSKHVLRWIFVLPVSFLAGLLALVPLHMFLFIWVYFFRGASPDVGSVRFFTDFFLNESTLESVETFLSPVVTMMTAVLVSYKMAPKYKFQTSVAIVLLWVVTMILVGMFFPNIKMDSRTLTTFILMLVALYFTWKKSTTLIPKV